MATKVEKEVELKAVLSPDGLREIEFAAQITALDISDVEEFVTFAVVLYTRYFDPNVVTKNPDAPDVYVTRKDYEGFIPTIVIDDLRDGMDREYSATTRVNYRTGHIWTSLLNTITVSQSMDFRRFPFDNQFLILHFYSTDSKLRPWTSDFEMLGFPALRPEEETKKEKHNALFAVLGAPDHWEMVNLEATFYQEPEGARNLFQSSCKVVCIAQRKPMFYFITYCIIVFFIVGTNICVIAINPDQAGDRDAITSTLLLTLVAFKYVITQGVTRVSYLTIMDYYVLISFGFIILAVLENVAISSIGRDYLKGKDVDANDEEVRQADFKFQLVYIISWTVFNFVVFILCMNPWILRRTFEKLRAQEHEKERTNVLRTGSYNTISHPENSQRAIELNVSSDI